jgi:hypothetical protein
MSQLRYTYANPCTYRHLPLQEMWNGFRAAHADDLRIIRGNETIGVGVMNVSSAVLSAAGRGNAMISDWRKSSRSGGGGCVEASVVEGGRNV